MKRAKARHILVKTEEECNKIKTKIEEGSNFEEMATHFSKCPSGKAGGDLGEFSPGQMVKEFDEVCFNADVGELTGPIKTQFGYHLIEVTKRS